MARIVYALSGQGRGHSSRSLAISELLRGRGHEVRFCCGGTAQEILEANGETVIEVPQLRTVVRNNAVLAAPTLLANWPSIVYQDRIAMHLAETLRAFRPDLLITDFEAFSWRAAERLNVPVISFNHQQIVTETEYELPTEHWLDAQVARAIINLIAPRNPERLLLTSFFFPPVKRPWRTHLVPPIIRKEVKALSPACGTHTLVYYNQPEGSQAFPDLLQKDGRRYTVYNFPLPDDPEQYPNVVFKPASITGFLEDLATSRAVICTAGFTLISEALFLGKPLLAVPNRGIFEQTINALFLEREGLGKAVIGRPLSAADLHEFHANLDHYTSRLKRWRGCGNTEAVLLIEEVLTRAGPSIHASSTPARRRAVPGEAPIVLPPE